MSYLITMVCFAIAVLLAMTAPQRSPIAARLSFFIGLAINEVPLLIFLLMLPATISLVTGADGYMPADWIGLGVAVLVSIGLLVILLRGIRARSVVESALDDGLGPNWRGDIDPSTLIRWQARPSWWRLLLVPWHARRRGVKRIADLAYGPDPKHRLDVYRPAHPAKDAPILVYFHGGGFSSGRKNREARPLMYRFASQGWVCISANYRLRPEFGFVDHITDAKQVIAWARSHGTDYGASETAAIFAAGSSAGAHLVSICAVTASDPQFQTGFEDADTSIDAGICLYGYYGHYYGLGPSARPISSALGHQITAAVPPLFVAHGDHDTLVHVNAARQFVAHVSTPHQRLVYAELPGAQHGFDIFRSVRFEAVMDGIDVFADSVLRDAARPRPTRSATPAE